MTTYAINEQFNGIEISFDSKPEEATRDSLKANGFRWHKVKKVWYARQTAGRLELAQSLAELTQTAQPTQAKKTQPKANKFGVVVGDIFSACWGYDQTNYDFFQVIELVGTQSVRVREVNPTMVSELRTAGEALKELTPFPVNCFRQRPTAFSLRIRNGETLRGLRAMQRTGSAIRSSILTASRTLITASRTA